MLVFVQGGKPENPKKKPSGQSEYTSPFLDTNKLKMALRARKRFPGLSRSGPQAGTEPGGPGHWWEAIALATAPSLPSHFFDIENALITP